MDSLAAHFVPKSDLTLNDRSSQSELLQRERSGGTGNAAANDQRVEIYRRIHETQTSRGNWMSGSQNLSGLSN
jgi:hypothetical protein